MQKKIILAKLLLPFVIVNLLIAVPSCAEVVNIYTERQQVFLERILDAFTVATGHTTNVLYLDKGAVARLTNEREDSPADVVIVADIGRLYQLVDTDLTQPIISTTVATVVPAQLKDPAGHWLALTKRLRVLFVAKDATDAPATFAELVDDAWRGKVCLRSGVHSYNIALFAALHDEYGASGLRNWLIGLKANLARAPQGNDRAQIKGVASGECGVAVANLYYYFKMLDSKDPAERAAAAKVRWVPASVGDAGAHVNISGIVLTKHAPHPAAALELIEFMLSAQAQSMYATDNGELPVRADVALPLELAAAARVAVDRRPLADIAALRANASQLVEDTGFGN